MVKLGLAMVNKSNILLNILHKFTPPEEKNRLEVCNHSQRSNFLFLSLLSKPSVSSASLRLYHPPRARFLGARRWAFAFALMVDVAGFLASLILLAVRIAFVHNVDDFGVGEVQSRVRPVTDAALVVLRVEDSFEQR